MRDVDERLTMMKFVVAFRSDDWFWVDGEMMMMIAEVKTLGCTQT